MPKKKSLQDAISDWEKEHEGENWNKDQINMEFKNRKKNEAQQIRKALGKDGRRLSDDEVLKEALRPGAEAGREAVAVHKFNKKAESAGAFSTRERQDAFRQNEVRNIMERQGTEGKSQQELNTMRANAEAQVNHALNKAHRYRALNG